MTTNKNRNYKRGYEKERKLVNQLRAKGCLSFRSAGSHSPIDVFALNPEMKLINLIQSKPKSMSKAQKDKILEDLKKYEGIYKVCVYVQ